MISVNRLILNSAILLILFLLFAPIHFAIAENINLNSNINSNSNIEYLKRAGFSQLMSQRHIYKRFFLSDKCGVFLICPILPNQEKDQSLKAENTGYSLETFDQLFNEKEFYTDIKPKKDFLVAFNAGFFDRKNRPLGLIRISGKTIRKQRHLGGLLSDSFIFFNGSEPKIIGDFRRLFLSNLELVSLINCSDNGIQSGPLLINEGRVCKSLGRLNNKKSSRLAVGFDKHDNFIIVLAFPLFPGSGMSLQEFAEVLARSVHEKGAHLEQAVNLDGGSSSQILIKQKNGYSRFGGARKVPLYITYK